MSHTDRTAQHASDDSFDWAGQIKLAIVLSFAAGMVASTLASRVAEPVLILAIIVVASIAGWQRVAEVDPPRPDLVRVRRR